MKNKTAHFFAILALSAVVYLGYKFIYEPYRTYEKEVFAIAASGDGQVLSNAMTYADRKLPFLNMSQWSIYERVQADDEGMIFRASRFLFEKLPFLSDSELNEMVEYTNGIKGDLPKAAGIIRVNADNVNIRKAVDPTDDSNIATTTNRGELYTYYAIESYENTPWYKVLTSNDFTAERYISGAVSDVVVDRSVELTADEREKLEQFIDYTFEQRNDSYDDYTTDTLLSYAIADRNFSNEVVKWVADSQSTSFHVDLLSATVVDGLKMDESTYWLRVQEEYDFTLKDGTPSYRIFSLDYTVKIDNGNFFIEEWFQVHQLQ